MSKYEDRIRELVEPDTLIYVSEGEDYLKAVVIPATLHITIRRIRYFTKDLVEQTRKSKWEVAVDLGTNRYEATVDTASEVLEFLKGVVS